MSDFLKILFDDGESVCLTDDVYGTALVSIDEAVSTSDKNEYVSINPLKGWRKDTNVTAFRNIVVEFDTLPLDEQLDLIEQSLVPFSSLVFSGNKSYHMIISLKNPLKDYREYMRTVSWIYAVFKLADKACKNPSRLSRMAGTIRKDSGLEQRLVILKERIENDALTSWLKSTGVAEPKVPVYAKFDKFLSFKIPLGITMKTKSFLKNGAEVGSRTHSVFAATCNLYRCGFNEDEIIKLTQKVLSFDKLPHLYRTVRCAIADVESKRNDDT